MISKDLKVGLSDERRAALGQEVAAHTVRYDGFEEEKKKLTKDLSDKMKEERATWRKKANALRVGYIVEPVECDEVEDFDRNEIRIIRRDTGETVESRAMTGADRQASIDFPDGSPVVDIKDAPKRRGKKAKTFDLAPDADAKPADEGDDPDGPVLAH